MTGFTEREEVIHSYSSSVGLFGRGRSQTSCLALPSRNLCSQHWAYLHHSHYRDSTLKCVCVCVFMSFCVCVCMCECVCVVQHVETFKGNVRVGIFMLESTPHMVYGLHSGGVFNKTPKSSQMIVCFLLRSITYH